MNKTASVSLALILVCGACQDETTGPVAGDFDQLCGKTEPVRLLALDPDQRPDIIQSLVLGDRYLVQLSNTHDSGGRISDVWSVGRCGEDPFLLAEQVDNHLKFYEPYPDITFGCRRDQDSALLALDPTGARASNVTFATQGCHALPTPEGLLTILGDQETGPLVLQRWPDDPFTETAEQVVLLDDVKHRPFPYPRLGSSEDEVLGATATEAFAVTAADELVAVALDSLAVEILATGVREFQHDSSGRWLVWQGVELSNDDPDRLEGPMFLLDRESGEVTELGESALWYTRGGTMLLESLGLFHYSLGDPYYEGVHRYLRLPDLESLDLPTGFQPTRIIDETRVLMNSSQDSVTSYVVVDITTGEPTTLYSRPHSQWGFHVGSEGLTALSGNGEELVRISYSGESKVLAPHVFGSYDVVSDGRVLTPFAQTSDLISELVIVDPDTHEQMYIDTHVYHASTLIHEEAPGEIIVSYQVVDDGRHGIWIAKPAK